MAELVEARQRGSVVSVSVTVSNPTDTPQHFNLKGKASYLLDYSDGQKYALIGLQGRRNIELPPQEQTVLRATFKAPPSVGSVAVVIEDLGTFEDVVLGK
jgi:hypothetical protein